MAGKKYSSLTAIKAVGVTAKSRNVIWLFHCECGNKCEIDGYSVRSGKSTSCQECGSKRTVAASITHGLTNTSEYSVWTDIKTRCYNKNRPEYNDYGGRGIFVCDRWLGKDGFSNFLSDMGKRPRNDLSIERVNNDKGYSPSNCVWATIYVQANNRRNNKKILFEGRWISPKIFSRLTGIRYNTVLARINAGKSGSDLFKRIQTEGSITYNGITDTYKGWSNRTGIKISTISMRLTKYKWPLEKALTKGATNGNA